MLKNPLRCDNHCVGYKKLISQNYIKTKVRLFHTATRIIQYLLMALLSRRSKVTKVELGGAHGVTAPCGRSRVHLCLQGYCRARGARLVLLLVLHVHINVTSSNSPCL